MNTEDMPIANKDNLNQVDCNKSKNKEDLHSQNDNYGIGQMKDSEIGGNTTIAGKINEKNRNQSQNTNIQLTINVDSQTKSDNSKTSSNNNYNKLVSFEIVISGKLPDENEPEYEKLRRRIENIIKKLSDLGEIKYNFEIKYIKKGSIKIGLEGHLEDFNKLQKLFESGQLSEILGIPVENIHLVVDDNSDNDDEIKNEEKFRLIEESKRKVAKDPDLNDVNTSDVDQGVGKLRGTKPSIAIATSDDFEKSYPLGWSYIKEREDSLFLADSFAEITPTPDPQQKPVSSAQTLKERLDWGEPGLTIIDVRDREKFNTERIMGAIAMPLDELASMAEGKFPGTREIYVYGENQEQSEQAASQLKQMGYNNVFQIQGGLSAWKAVSGPTEGRIG